MLGRQPAPGRRARPQVGGGRRPGGSGGGGQLAALQLSLHPGLLQLTMFVAPCRNEPFIIGVAGGTASGEVPAMPHILLRCTTPGCLVLVLLSWPLRAAAQTLPAAGKTTVCDQIIQRLHGGCWWGWRMRQHPGRPTHPSLSSPAAASVVPAAPVALLQTSAW